LRIWHKNIEEFPEDETMGIKIPRTPKRKNFLGRENYVRERKIDAEKYFNNIESLRKKNSKN